MEGSSENIKVYVRLRPLPSGEERSWKVEGGNTVTPLQRAQGDGYSLDSVFDEQSKTSTVYEMTTKKLIEQVIDGFNSTVFAYGQTSSGKTYTMKGSREEPGIIPLSVQDLFRMMQEKSNERDFLVRISYMEIYNEEIRDLLAEGESCQSQVAIKQSAEQGIFVDGLQEVIATSVEHVLHLVDQGEEQRHVGETRMNKRSSRSHAIFRMVIESRARSASSAAVKLATLNLVDLAGSERISKTGAEGQRKKEGAAINKSLLSLGTVISKLSEGASHIPYRDSKLTRILQPSLGGNAKTAIICAITPAVEHCEESHSTLRFACRAKTVVNTATMNEVLTDAALLRKQAKEIEELKKQIGTGTLVGQDAIKRKIATITNIMLTKKRDSEAMGGSIVRDPGRRKTWCPGPFDEDKPGKLRRVSDGHLMFQDRIDRLFVAAEAPPSDSTKHDSLHKQIEQLKNANNLMKRELNAMGALAQKRKKELQAKDDEMKKVMQDKGNVLPALKEAEWKNRQLEKNVHRYKTELESTLDKLSKQESQYLGMLADKDAQLADVEVRAKKDLPDAEAAKLQNHSRPEFDSDLIEAKAEIEALRHKNERLQVAQDNALQQLAERTTEVGRLQRELKNASKIDAKSQSRYQDLEDEIRRLNSHVADLEKRKRAPLYQKKQEEELKAALTKASEAEERALQAEEEASAAANNLAQSQAIFEKMKEEYEAKILDLQDKSFALSKKLENAMEQPQQAISLQTELDLVRNRAEELEKIANEKEDLCSSLQSEAEDLRSKYENAVSQIEEIQACADAASSHIRFLEERLEKEAQEAELILQQANSGHAEQIQALEKNARELEDMYEKSKIEIEALISENKELKDTTESLERRIDLASSSLNAADELRELKKRHKEEVARLNAQLKSTRIGSKGNEKAMERAAKDSTRLKNQIGELETKLKKAVAEKSSLQSERAALEREHRTVKAQLERLSKNAEKSAAIEERKRRPLVKELAEATERLAALEEELTTSRSTLEESQQRRSELQQLLETEREKHADALSVIEGYRQDLESSREQCDDLMRKLELQKENLDESSIQITTLETSLKDANKEIARLTEESSKQQAAVKSGSEKEKELQRLVNALQNDKKTLESSLAEAEANTEMMDSLRLDLQAEKAHVLTIQQNFELLERGLEDHKRELTLSEEARRKAEATAEAHANALSEKEQYISSLESQVNENMAKAMEMEATLDASRSEVKKLGSLLSQAEHAIEEHDSTINEIHREKVAIEKSLEASTQSRKMLERQLEQYQLEIQQFEHRLQQGDESLRLAEESMQRLMASFEEEKDGLAKRVRDLEEENRRIAAEMQSEMQELGKAKDDQQHVFQKEIARFKEAGESALKEAQRMHEQELQRLQEQIKSSHDCSASEHAKHERAIADLQASLEQASSEKENLIEEKRSILSELQSLRDMAKDKERTVAQQGDQVASLEIRIKELQSQLGCKASQDVDALRQKCMVLETELRKSKRREEKLQALQYRLQQDFKQSLGSVDMFSNLREVRSLEYELDRTANRAEKEITALRAALQKATESSRASTRPVLIDKENTQA